MASVAPNTTPALEPPPGVTPNFIGQYTRQISYIGTSAACLSLATIGIVIRIFTKVFILKQVYLEDCEYHILVNRTAFNA
jgi:hypothetical protein